MSHFTSIDIEIRDLEALRSACRELSLPFEADTTARGYAGSTRKAEHVIRLNGPYDVALTRRKNGTFKVEADFWEGHVEKELGPRMGRLRQLYAVHKATREARRKGYRVQRQCLPDQTIRLCIASA